MVTTPTQWQEMRQVNTTDDLRHQIPGAVTALPDGGYFVVWSDSSLVHNARGTAVVGQRYDALGNRVGGEVNVGLFTETGDQFAPVIATLPDGGILVVYVDRYDDDFDIRAVRSDPTLTQFSRINVQLSDTLQNSQPAVTVLADGSFIVAYEQQNGGDTDIMANLFDANGVRVHLAGGGVGQFAIDNVAETSNWVKLATLSNNRVVAVFVRENATTGHDVYFKILSPTGNTLAGPAPVAGAADGLSGGGGDDGTEPLTETEPVVAALAGGGFVVAWTDFLPGSDGDVRMSIYSNAGLLRKGDIAVATGTGGQSQPEVVALADGTFVVSWFGSSSSIVGRRFNKNGNPIGDEFVIQPNASGYHYGAQLADGRIVYVGGTQGQFGEFDVHHSIWDPRDDQIAGTAGDDVLTSRRDGATVDGLGGNDTVYGLGAADVLRGGGGNDVLRGGGAADTLQGGAGNDRLSGQAGNDILRGGAGADTLDGGAGNDRLFGEGGSDRFVFAPGGGTDRIKDFQDGTDRIDLSAFGFASVQAAKALATNQQGNVVFDFDGDGTLIVEGITKAQLTAADLIV